MEVANTLAYYDTARITAVKSFIVQSPGCEIRLFFVGHVNCPYFPPVYSYNRNDGVNGIEQNFKDLQNEACISTMIKISKPSLSNGPLSFIFGLI